MGVRNGGKETIYEKWYEGLGVVLFGNLVGGSKDKRVGWCGISMYVFGLLREVEVRVVVFGVCSEWRGVLEWEV